MCHCYQSPKVEFFFHMIKMCDHYQSVDYLTVTNLLVWSEALASISWYGVCLCDQSPCVELISVINHLVWSFFHVIHRKECDHSPSIKFVSVIIFLVWSFSYVINFEVSNYSSLECVFVNHLLVWSLSLWSISWLKCFPCDQSQSVWSII